MVVGREVYGCCLFRSVAFASLFRLNFGSFVFASRELMSAWGSFGEVRVHPRPVSLLETLVLPPEMQSRPWVSLNAPPNESIHPSIVIAFNIHCHQAWRNARHDTTSLLLRRPSLLRALVVRQMPIPRRGPRELRPALGTIRLGRGAGLLALMAQQVAEGRELAAVAAVLPALRLGPLVEHADRGVRCLAAEGLGQGVGHVAADEGAGVAHALAGGVH